jgi:uncharacterized repeat protein (TIGR01451 family)
MARVSQPASIVALRLLFTAGAALTGAAFGAVSILTPADGTVATADPCPVAPCTARFAFEVEVTGAPMDSVFLEAHREEGFGFNQPLCTPPDPIEGIPGCPDPPFVFSRSLGLRDGSWTITAQVRRGDRTEVSAPVRLTVFPPDIEPAGPVALIQVLPLEGETTTVLRDPDPRFPDGLSLPPSEVQIFGQNLHNNPFLEVRVAPIPFNEPSLTLGSALPLLDWCTFEAEILERGVAPDGRSFLRVAVPELPETTPTRCGIAPGPEGNTYNLNWRWIVTDRWLRPERQHAHWAIPSPRVGEAWAGAPPFRVIRPGYPRFHGFGFRNHATDPRYREFQTVYGNNAYLCVGAFGVCVTRIPDPLYHLLWWPIYRKVIGSTDGSCNGMASTSLLLARGQLQPSDFEPGVQCAFGFADPGPDSVPDGGIMRGVARYRNTNFCTPVCSPSQPDNLWATIRMNHGVQLSRQFLFEMLRTLGEAIFDPNDITSIKGVPNATLERVAANPRGYVLCFFEPGNGHCVTPYAVQGNRILIFENNAPGDETRFIEISGGRYSYPARTSSPNQGKAIMAFPISIWEGGRNLLGLEELATLIRGDVVKFLYMIAVGAGDMTVTNDDGGRWGWEADGSFTDEMFGAVSIAPLGPQEVDARAMPLLVAMNQPEPTAHINADGDGPYIFHTAADGHLFQLESASAAAGDRDRVDVGYRDGTLGSFDFTPQRDAARVIPRVGLALEGEESALFHWHGLEVPGGTSAGFAGDKDAVSVTYRNATGAATRHVLVLDHASGAAEHFGRTVFGPFEVPAGASHTVSLPDWPDVSQALSELDRHGDGTVDETELVPGLPLAPPLEHGAEADLSVAATADPGVALPGEGVTRTVTVRNDGPDDATGVLLLEALPAGLEVADVGASQGACTPGARLTCELGTIAVGASVEVTFTATASELGRLSSVVTVYGSESDPDPTNNVATTVVHVTSEVAALAVTRGGASPGEVTLRAGDDDVAVLQAILQALAAEDVAVASVELTAALAAGSAAGADTLEHLTVKAYHDRDGDGQVGAGDVLLASGSLGAAGAGGVVVLELDGLVVPAGASEHLLIALDLEPAPAGAALAATMSLTALVLTGLLWRRRRQLLAITALALALVMLTGCPQRPAEVELPTTMEVSLTGIAGEAAVSGAPVSVSGLPLEGATVTIGQ